MDMNMDMAPDPAVVNLPLSDPLCVKAAEDCLAYYAAENASQAATPWAGQFAYGHYVTYYWVIILGLVFIFYALQSIQDLKDPIKLHKQGKKPGILRKAQAGARFIFYRHFSYPRGNFSLPSYGYSALLGVTLIFLTALVFAEKPYYRPQLGFGAPPIAIRSGLMAYACVPILVALAGKANIVTVFTGISHEKLNVLHRWISWFSFVLSLIHTIPFFYASVNDPGNGGAQRVKSEFYFWGTVIGASEYSGVPALAILFAMCVLSLPQIREWAYETFYGLHILLATTYLGLLFWHGGNLEDSWAYLWATVGIWGASWLARAFWKNRSTHLKGRWFETSAATVKEVGGDVTRIEVWPSDEFRFEAGQHVFLRFMNISALENHPFTIASAPLAISTSDEKTDRINHGAQTPLVFLARSHSGFTRRLLSHANQTTLKDSTATSVVIDGPYGGIHRPIEKLYDTIILVAGGTGITACLPWLLQIIALAQMSSTYLRTKRIVLVWAIRHMDAFSWVEHSLVDAVKAQTKGLEVILQFHVTGLDEEIVPKKSDTVANTKEMSSGVTDDVIEMPKENDARTRIADLGVVSSGRPQFSSVLEACVSEGNNIILGCGPEGFKIELANAVAGTQKRVLRGDCNEIAMHLETFGW